MRTRLVELLIALLIGCCVCAVSASAQVTIKSFTVASNQIIGYGAPGTTGTVTLQGNLCSGCSWPVQWTVSPNQSPPLLFGFPGPL